MVSYDQTIPPGGQGKITVKVNTAGYKGPVRKSVRVETNDPHNTRLRLYLEAQVTPVFSVKPWRRVYISTPQGKAAVQTLTLTNVLDRPVEITGLYHDLRGLMEAQLVTVDKGWKYELVVKAGAEIRTRQSGWVHLGLSGLPVKDYRIRAYIDVWRPRKRITSPPVRTAPRGTNG
ncbi:MAG: DUF1573 domain-containing protein [Deltaproteobacteria bacterium]|nr:DUF1573 domain-containing protein [Deltaproteobacteria bacterium]